MTFFTTLKDLGSLTMNQINRFSLEFDSDWSSIYTDFDFLRFFIEYRTEKYNLLVKFIDWELGFFQGSWLVVGFGKLPMDVYILIDFISNYAIEKFKNSSPFKIKFKSIHIFCVIIMEFLKIYVYAKNLQLLQLKFVWTYLIF